jgi:hypothetical protein
VISEFAVTTVSDFEYVTPRKNLDLFLPIRLYLPYGYWVEQNGARVIFNRDYKPMWRVHDGGLTERIDPWDRIHFNQQVFLWEDAKTPWHSPLLRQTLEETLKAWNLRCLPIVADALPLLVAADDVEFSSSAGLLQQHRRAFSGLH